VVAAEVPPAARPVPMIPSLSRPSSRCQHHQRQDQCADDWPPPSCHSYHELL
jgi:hypothetical protein